MMAFSANKNVKVTGSNEPQTLQNKLIRLRRLIYARKV